MKKETIQAIAAALHALADEFLGSPSPDAAPEALTGEPVTTGKRRGRSAATTAAPANAEPSSAPATAEKVDGNPTGQIPKDLEDKSPTELSPTELWEENKERIRPVITAGFGTKVKAIVANYSPTSMKDIPVDKIPAFRKEFQAFSDFILPLAALTQPLIKDGRGAEVQKVVSNYSPTGMTDIPVDKIPAFRRDIEALTI